MDWSYGGFVRVTEIVLLLEKTDRETWEAFVDANASFVRDNSCDYWHEYAGLQINGIQKP